VTKVYWSNDSQHVAITSQDSFYVLRYDSDAYRAFLDTGGDLGDEGVEEAFVLEAEVAEPVRTGKWLGECFVYTTTNNRLNYIVGGQSHTVSHFDQLRSPFLSLSLSLSLAFLLRWADVLVGGH
jgi:coatomer subunit beta'